MHQSLDQAEPSFTGIEVDENEFNEPASKKKKKQSYLKKILY